MVINNEFSPLTRRFWRQATWFENHAKLIRSSPTLFKDSQGLAEICERFVDVCEQLGEVAQNEYERRISIRSEA